MKNRRQLIFFALILFYLFGFRYIEPYIIPPVQSWIQSSGPMAGIYYFIAGLVSVVVAPITLGPIHVILQKSFGFWNSFWLFYSFVTVGQLINFGLAKRYGDKFVNKFAPELKNNNIYNWLKNNLDRNLIDLMIIHVGLGGDFLAYIFGLSKVKFYKFAIVAIVVNLFSTWIIVSKNLSVGDTSNYLLWFLSSYFITYIPLLIVFRKDLPKLWDNFKASAVKKQGFDNEYKKAKEDYKNGNISQNDLKKVKEKADKNTQNPFSDLFVDKEG
jgi:uncharacterized membrane protein YdjX (TVP38/TMEM64 family)